MVRTINTLKRRFAVCIDYSGYQVSRIPRKVYQVVLDQQATADSTIRIVDEGGEDYWYHTSRFLVVEFPAEVERALVAAQTGR